MTKINSFPALCLVALALAFGGCGSGSSESTTATDTPATSTAAAPKHHTAPAGGGPQGKHRSQGKQPNSQSGRTAPEEPAHFEPSPHHDSGGGVEQFEAKGGDNSIQESGDEASAGEFTEAAATLHAFLDARAARAWKAACAQMSQAVVKGLVSQLGAAGKGGDCAQVLYSLTAAVPDGALREAAVADVGALRVDGDHGFVLFSGPGGQSFFMPMAREGGHWKVAAVAASLLP